MKKIGLTRGKSALVDDDDYEILSRFVWNLKPHRHTFYACAHVYNDEGVRTTMQLHRLIMGAKKGQMLDHINGNGLDNRKENLRFVTQSENTRNSRKRRYSTSQYFGVTYEKRAKKWRARHVHNGKRVSIGMFETEKEAAKAYNDFLIKIGDNFSRKNSL